MTEDQYRRPLTPPGDPRTAPDVDRPAPGPDAPGDPGATFPRDQGLEGQATERSSEPGVAPAGGGAPQAVDPGLADQAPERPAERPAWGHGTDGGQASTYPPGEGPEGRATGLPHEGDAGSYRAGAANGPEGADQASERPAGGPAWGEGGAGGATATGPSGAGPQGQATGRPYDAGQGAAAGAGAQADAGGQIGQQPGGRLDQAAMDRFRQRWASVQGAFVDDPRNAIAEADRLVAEVIREVEQRLTRHREIVQGEWSRGEADTEQLRQLVHRYRALFHRLLETEF